MVSYCRKQKPFVSELVRFLHTIGIDPWVDWEDIPPAVGAHGKYFVRVGGAGGLDGVNH